MAERRIPAVFHRMAQIMHEKGRMELSEGCRDMRTQQTGMGGLQLLLVTAAIAAVSWVVTPEHEAAFDTEKIVAQRAKLADALDFARESRHKIARSYLVSHSLPRTASEAHAMKPTMIPRPEFVQEVKLQHDYAGEMVMIMVYLNNGVVENILGGEQYIYIAGIKSDEGDGSLEWQCGARNVDLTLLPEECRS